MATKYRKGSVAFKGIWPNDIYHKGEYIPRIVCEDRIWSIEDSIEEWEEGEREEQEEFERWLCNVNDEDREDDVADTFW